MTNPFDINEVVPIGKGQELCEMMGVEISPELQEELKLLSVCITFLKTTLEMAAYDIGSVTEDPMEKGRHLPAGFLPELNESLARAMSKYIRIATQAATDGAEEARLHQKKANEKIQAIKDQTFSPL